MEKKISVIMLTYNRKELLHRALDSVLQQEFKEFELILINNGSTDGTDEVCNEYAKNDNRIRYFTIKENQGIAFARNFGIDHVQTDYIVIVDDDDYCEKTMFSHLYGMIEEYNADIAITGCVDEFSDGTIRPRYQYDELYVWDKEEGVSEFLKREKFDAAPCTKLFRTSLFQTIRFMLGTRIDDIHVIYKLFVEANRVVSQAYPSYRFYKHSGNETSFLSGDKLKPEILDEYLNMQEERVSYISKHLPSLTSQVRYAKYSYMISMVERIETGLAINCEKQLLQMKRILTDNIDEFLNAKWITEREIRLFKKYVEKR